MNSDAASMFPRPPIGSGVKEAVPAAKAVSGDPMRRAATGGNSRRTGAGRGEVSSSPSPDKGAALESADSTRERLPTGLAYRATMTEAQVQQAVFEHLARRAPGGLNQIGGVIAYHPKNGGVHQQTAGQRIANRRQGVLPGVPDVILHAHGKTYWLELKSLRGSLSAEQQSLAHIARSNGIVTGIAFGIDEALAWLERHKLLVGSVQ